MKEKHKINTHNIIIIIIRRKQPGTVLVWWLPLPLNESDESVYLSEKTKKNRNLIKDIQNQNENYYFIISHLLSIYYVCSRLIIITYFSVGRYLDVLCVFYVNIFFFIFFFSLCEIIPNYIIFIIIYDYSSQLLKFKTIYFKRYFNLCSHLCFVLCLFFLVWVRAYFPVKILIKWKFN